MPERVSNARVLLWIQAVVNGCLGVFSLPVYFPTDEAGFSDAQRAVLNAAGSMAFAFVALLVVCAVLLGRGMRSIYVLTLALQALNLVAIALSFSWFQLLAVTLSVAVVWILLLPVSRRWFFRARVVQAA